MSVFWDTNLFIYLIERHPEYHALLEHPERALSRDYLPESGQTNPFLHMGLHLALREQVATDRPPGIRGIWQRLASRLADPHEAEHRMSECLAEALREAYRFLSFGDAMLLDRHV